LGGEGEGSDAGVVEGFLCGFAAGDLVAFPEAGEGGAFEEEFADEIGQVGCIGGGAGDGAQPGPARAYIEELMPDVLDGAITPGRVFNESFSLDQVPDAYQAMTDRRVLKALITL
jgi:hypothetical protein